MACVQRLDEGNATYTEVEGISPSRQLYSGRGGIARLSYGTEQQATSPEFPGVTLAASISSSNFQQCGNGDDGGETCVYINGVLNDTKSLYREGEVIAERVVIPGLVVGHTYRLAFDYGWEKAKNPGHMNYDFIAGWNTTLGSLAIPAGIRWGTTRRIARRLPLHGCEGGGCPTWRAESVEQDGTDPGGRPELGPGATREAVSLPAPSGRGGSPPPAIPAPPPGSSPTPP